MTYLMQNELDKLKKQLLALTAEVEEAVEQALKALETFDVPLARKVIDGDERIDQMEVELEEECLKVLALHQPVAVDLRFIIAVLKLNNDLERIGDLAANIAERALALADTKRISPPYDIGRMGGTTRKMLKGSLDCLVQMNTHLAQDVLDLDDEVDAMHSGNFQLIKDRIRTNVDELESLTQYLTVSRHLERIADLATNIAEEVFYMIEGEIVRHTSNWTHRER
ncbi:MAG TPA: phosphate signaling complex protein PhoU [Desulfuromonadales bacterium]|nr:phosphate signaling complex protein PhoU [Desulfuromonadales bacterium]